jgi:hypothetical protein
VTVIRHDQDFPTLRRQECDVWQRLEIVGADPNGARNNELRCMCNRVVGKIATNIAAVDRNRSLTHGASAIIGMRSKLGVGR